MSREARDWAWTLEVSPPQKLVVLALAEHADEFGDCWPSLTRLSDLTGLARSTVTEALAALETARLIDRQRGSSGRTTRYRLLIGPAALGESPAARPPPSGRGTAASPGAGLDSPPRGPAGSPPPGLVRPPVVRPPDQPSPGGGPTGPPDGPAVVRPADPNRQLNRHEPSVNRRRAASPPNRADEEPGRRGKARPIPPGWQPGERVFAWAAGQGLTRAWVAAQVAEFVVYWSDAGEARRSWDATFMNRLRALQAQAPRGANDASVQPLAAKDYRSGATPLADIPWLKAAAVG
ncbi:MAG: DnaT-like ssDNA-binding domain-containing protein [Burkholderiales bacterium]|nr:DnaT-like ssDNA-binding domain-containing protein [Burkholderiales bacterium]